VARPSARSRERTARIRETRLRIVPCAETIGDIVRRAESAWNAEEPRSRTRSRQTTCSRAGRLAEVAMTEPYALADNSEGEVVVDWGMTRVI
jgi:hypothetical protein